MILWRPPFGVTVGRKAGSKNELTLLFMKDWNHDLVHQLSEDLDSLWRYGQYLKKSKGCRHCVLMWKKFQQLDKEKTKMLREEIVRHIREKRFG